MDKEAELIRSETLKICWYMRGGVTYADALMLNIKEREIIGKLIKENLETTKKTGLPFY